MQYIQKTHQTHSINSGNQSGTDLGGQYHSYLVLSFLGDLNILPTDRCACTL